MHLRHLRSVDLQSAWSLRLPSPTLLRDTIIGCQRYHLEPAQLFPTFQETFAATAGACSRSPSLTGENYTVSLSSAGRERDNILPAELFQTLARPASFFPYLHLLGSVTPLKSIVNRRLRLILTGRENEATDGFRASGSSFQVSLGWGLDFLLIKSNLQ